MLDIRVADDGSIHFTGRFDASQEPKARQFMDALDGRRHVLDFGSLEYISSAGLGVLLAVQKRLMEAGGSLRIVNASKHIRDIFFFSGLSRIFEIP